MVVKPTKTVRGKHKLKDLVARIPEKPGMGLFPDHGDSEFVRGGGKPFAAATTPTSSQPQWVVRMGAVEGFGVFIGSFGKTLWYALVKASDMLYEKLREFSKVIVLVNTASASTISGESVFVGRMQVQKMWKSLITTEERLL